jgi:S1-C subfamily serine protease
MVVVISAPEGFHDTATYGRVSNIHQTLGENAPSQAWQDIIFIDADILEGSSGGMVLGTDGLVYGIVMGVTGQHAEIGIGESSVSPSNKIKSLIDKL